MKGWLFLLTLLFIISCREADNENITTAAPPAPDIVVQESVLPENESSDWINDFRTLRDAVYQGNREKVKSYFEFPVMNYSNEIWYLVHMGDSIFNSIDAINIEPFTEQDFDKYFSKLFSREFIKSILKIKSEELFEKGAYETAELRKDNSSTYTMRAKFHKEENRLTLSLFSVEEIQEEGVEEPFNAEFSILYEFEVINNSKLRFKQIRIAG